MPKRRPFLALLALAPFLSLVPLGLAGAARAEATQRFTPDTFAEAQKAGEPILIEVSAPWCPICKAQKPILAELGQRPRFRKLRVFEVDFDTQKDVLRRFDARMQSTLIVFKGETETGRSVGETQPEWIEGLVEKAF